MNSKLWLAAATIFLSISTPLLAADPTVLRVIVVQSDKPDVYVKEVLETGRAHIKRLEGTGNIRVWRAKFAGRDAGSIVVSIEYPNMAALVEDDKKIAADPAMRTWIKDLDKVRKIVSDSLYSESNP